MTARGTWLVSRQILRWSSSGRRGKGWNCGGLGGMVGGMSAGEFLTDSISGRSLGRWGLRLESHDLRGRSGIV
jgi:hypothetical protein